MKVERTAVEDSPQLWAEGCMAKLEVGSLHDDKLLICETVALDTFPSPYIVLFAADEGAEGNA